VLQGAISRNKPTDNPNIAAVHSQYLGSKLESRLFQF
jgi:hypothetical protein